MINKYYTFLPQEHMVILYKDENNIIDILVNYIKTNMDNNNRCIYITGDTDTKLLIDNLKRTIDYDRYINSQQLILLDKEDSYSKDGYFNPDQMINLIISKTNSALSDGFNGLAITGEISWVLAMNDGFSRIMEYEWKLNDRVFSKHPVSSICRYNLTKFSDEMIKSIIQVHPYIIWKGKAHENPFYIPSAAFKDNQLTKYQVSTWLENICKFTRAKSEFKTQLENKEKELIESEEKYKYVFENSPIAKSLTTPAGQIKVNNAFCELLGYTKEQLEGELWETITHPDDVELSKAYVDDLLIGKIEVARFNKRYIHKNSSTVWVDIHVSLRRDSNNKPLYFITSIVDITAQKKYENELINTKENFKLMFEDAPLPYQSLDEEGGFLVVNKAWLELLGYKIEEVIGKNFGDFIKPEYKDHFKTNFPKFKYEGATCTAFEMPNKNGDFLTVNFNGRIGYNDDGSFRQTHCILQDITEQLRTEKKLTYLSYHDQLTGIYNRRFFEEELLRLDTESNLPLTLMMTDVNGLKLVNDSFGHNFGDEMLKKVANIISKECRSNDIVARIGGDEFVIILPNTNSEKAEQLVKQIEKSLSKEEVSSVKLSISFGYDTKTSIETDINSILTSAEDYMYKRKVYESASLHNKIVDIIMNALYEKSNRELLHSERVSKYCEDLAKAMNMDKDSVNQIKIAGLLHDIGKIGIDESILNKPGKLEVSEWEEMKKHPESSWRILAASDEFSNLAGFVREHHERWDGNGYPKGLKEEEISIEARIICIADSYDAMTSKRTYKDSMSKIDAINEIIKNKGKQFDPEIADVFINKVLENM